MKRRGFLARTMAFFGGGAALTASDVAQAAEKPPKPKILAGAPRPVEMTLVDLERREVAATFQDRPTAIYFNGLRMREGRGWDYSVKERAPNCFELRFTHRSRSGDWIRAEF
jgi:hypothetical protein